LAAVLVLLVTTVLCRSLAALIIGVAGALVLLSCRASKGPVAMTLLLLVAPIYIGVRAPSLWNGEYLLEGVTQVFGADRADSVQDRLENDDLMIQRAVERPVFGWGGWGRSRVYVKPEGEDSSGKNGLWIIAFD